MYLLACAQRSSKHTISPSKSTEKIDGVVATIMAVDRAIRRTGDHHTSSVCGQFGLLVL
ncbi:hypothetical protein O6R08_09850 [Cutibacterium equinum]|uniref:Uncharacterized protein n=1 Tax=Cutibacterium equinum TaxID=3016342 RepID=A0ABY7R1P9_9ACTN|nr:MULTISPECIES: hypothetical protein [Cutibacterium]WCC81231.1 hypothetical protein O6R08_09850 [Cutibacterium equinum]